MENKTVKPDNLTFVHICAMIVTIVACAVCIGISVASAKGYYTDINANYVKEYATIIRYEKVRRQHNAGYVYTTYYEYAADDMIYSGICQRNIQTEEEAKAKIGKKVPIYVDHTLKHHTPSLHTSTIPIWVAGSLSVAFFGIFLNSFIREIIYIIRWKKYKKEWHIRPSIQR